MESSARQSLRRPLQSDVRSFGIGMASPMLQEIFTGTLIGLPDVGFNALTAEKKASIAGIAAGFGE